MAIFKTCIGEGASLTIGELSLVLTARMTSSLLVEPKQPADTPPSSDMRHLFNWATRSQVQQPTSA